MYSFIKISLAVAGLTVAGLAVAGLAGASLASLPASAGEIVGVQVGGVGVAIGNGHYYDSHHHRQSYTYPSDWKSYHHPQSWYRSHTQWNNQQHADWYRN